MPSFKDLIEANSVILNALQTNENNADIDDIRIKIATLSYFFNKKEFQGTPYCTYVYLLNLIYNVFECDTLQNRKKVITLSKKIDNAINSTLKDNSE
jgi:hypothetical protein